MRLMLTLPLLAALALPLTGCFDRDDHRGKKGHGHCDGDAAIPTNVTDLTSHTWIQDAPASSASTKVYRSQVAVQRGYFSYTFAATGDYTSKLDDCTSSGINKAGTWALKGSTLTLYPTGGAAEVMQIVSINATELQLAQ